MKQNVDRRLPQQIFLRTNNLEHVIFHVENIDIFVEDAQCLAYYVFNQRINCRKNEIKRYEIWRMSPQPRYVNKLLDRKLALTRAQEIH